MINRLQTMPAAAPEAGRLQALIRSALITLLVIFLLTGCAARQVQDSLAGATAQRLVTGAIDELAAALPASDFAALRGQNLYLDTHFIADDALRAYADRRLAMELKQRFDINTVAEPLAADASLSVFYTALGTDQGLLGFYLPFGFVPGVAESTRINLITLEQFHGVAEMYYFLDAGNGELLRGQWLQGRTRTDALGLPIITIPISNLD